MSAPVVSEFQLDFLAFLKVLAFAPSAFLPKHRTLKRFTAKIVEKNVYLVSLSVHPQNLNVIFNIFVKEFLFEILIGLIETVP